MASPPTPIHSNSSSPQQQDRLDDIDNDNNFEHEEKADLENKDWEHLLGVEDDIDSETILPLHTKSRAAIHSKRSKVSTTAATYTTATSSFRLARPGYLCSTLHLYFEGIIRLWDRNPATVISGRYTIHLRQGLLLMVLLISLTAFWVLATGASAFSVAFEGDDLDGNRSYSRARTAGGTQRAQKSFGLGEGWGLFNGGRGKAPTGFVYPVFVPSPEDPPTAKDRFERVRGRGAQTHLKKIQFDFLPETAEEEAIREQRRKAVKAGFEHAWEGYRQHAWGHDEVLPVTGGARDSFNGWGATMIDSLDTMVIMGLNKEFDEALQWIKTQFSMSGDPTAQLQFFETVIRYMGGFLSSYDLTGEQVLLEKAKELGDYMLNAFGPEGEIHRTFPDGRVSTARELNFKAGSGLGFVLAEVGTIQVEFTRLSQLTGDPIYEEKARKVFEQLGGQTQELPGLLPPNVQDLVKHHYMSYRTGMGGMVDSYYEYLLKEWILLDGEPEEYLKSFETAMDSMQKYLVSFPSDGSEDFAIVGTVASSTKEVTPSQEHLACFVAGSLAMGSKYLDRPRYMEMAQKVAQACYLTYHHSKTGLGPEAAKFEVAPDSKGKLFVVDQESFFSPKESRPEYILRPETIESLWILYRLTGEKKYQDQAWEIFQALERSCKTDIAYSGLKNVNEPGSFNNNMESFFLAETMKYLYLMFSTPDVISLDDFVLNTEAHPILRT
ncbi:hypothetical protein EMPS_00524 [Entomortierella parvispora]|uniref:alpha-1,2-Mannosidase n=1 Tax=Entomortierella parvispora TaxID=205924 RepID=A0A9P3H135_9FUNG|nr:hypothetical protein EMPS_00524 [Entomortierella parvispora]